MLISASYRFIITQNDIYYQEFRFTMGVNLLRIYSDSITMSL